MALDLISTIDLDHFDDEEESFFGLDLVDNIVIGNPNHNKSMEEFRVPKSWE